jgi:type I restriction enzyme R subunit
MDDVARQSMVARALEIDDVVRTAVSENSLSPQSIEAAIRKGLLPLLFGELGLDRTKEAVEQIVQMTRVGLGKSL